VVQGVYVGPAGAGHSMYHGTEVLDTTPGLGTQTIETEDNALPFVSGAFKRPWLTDYGAECSWFLDGQTHKRMRVSRYFPTTRVLFDAFRAQDVDVETFRIHAEKCRRVSAYNQYLLASDTSRREDAQFAQLRALFAQVKDPADYPGAARRPLGLVAAVVGTTIPGHVVKLALSGEVVSELRYPPTDLRIRALERAVTERSPRIEVPSNSTVVEHPKKHPAANIRVPLKTA
jgi:hypothetical protein